MDALVERLSRVVLWSEELRLPLHHGDPAGREQLASAARLLGARPADVMRLFQARLLRSSRRHGVASVARPRQKLSRR